MLINLTKSHAQTLIEIINTSYTETTPEYSEGYIDGLMDVLSTLKISLRDLSNLTKEISSNIK